MTQSALRSIGVLLIILAALAILNALQVFRFHSRLLTWMDAWGPKTAWVIRIATGLVGASLLFLTPRADD